MNSVKYQMNCNDQSLFAWIIRESILIDNPCLRGYYVSLRQEVFDYFDQSLFAWIILGKWKNS